jgi:hypothetical protein
VRCCPFMILQLLFIYGICSSRTYTTNLLVKSHEGSFEEEQSITKSAKEPSLKYYMHKIFVKP